MRSLLTIILSLALIAPCLAEKSAKKFIEYGWDCPDTASVKQNIAEMEKIPFDGVVIRVTPSDGGSGTGTDALGWKVFSKNRFKPEDYEHAIADLRATKFKTLKNNFIQVISMTGDLDWFDADWSAVAHNAACLARVVKEGECKGIMFDPEMYGEYPIWSYRRLKDSLKSERTYIEYVAQVRARGREFMRAINKEFPDVEILCLYGPSLTYVQSPCNPVKADYSLLPPFFDGMCEAATPGTKIIDGCELSYAYRTTEQFADAKRMILETCKSISPVPSEYGEHMRLGFGIWADYASGRIGWHPDDLSKNFFSPEALRTSLHYALQQSDEYVWVYSERFLWWGGTAPKEFIEALRMAKAGPAPK